MPVKITGPVQWGIIGCGDVCEVKSGPAFSKVPNSHLVAVMRRDRAKAKDFAGRHHVARYYTDADELIADDHVNAIYVATPPAFHEDYTIRALKAGKPVYVEKPVSTNAASVVRMMIAAKDFGQRVVVAHYRRGLSLFREVKSIVERQVIGPVRQIHVRTFQPHKNIRSSDNWRVIPELSGGGLFHDLSPHQLDILYWIFGEPGRVQGHSINRSRQYDAPDFTFLEARFKNEVHFKGEWTFNVGENEAEDSCEIIGQNGRMRFSFFKRSTIELTTDEGGQILKFDYPENIQRPMIEATVKFFRGEGPNPCPLNDALVTMKMMDSVTKPGH